MKLRAFIVILLSFLLFSFFVGGVNADWQYAEKEVGSQTTNIASGVGHFVQKPEDNSFYICSIRQLESAYDAYYERMFCVLPTKLDNEVYLSSNKDSALVIEIEVYNGTSETYEYVGTSYDSAQYSNPNINFSNQNMSTSAPLRYGDQVKSGEKLP